MFATIVFAAVAASGPTYSLTHNDGSLHVTVRYRMSPPESRDEGARVSSGTVTIRYGVRAYSYDLAGVLPIRTHRVELFDNPRDGGCGATQSLTSRGHYAVIEAVWAEKGCRPVASIIDLDSGRIARIVDVDHRWTHRNDVVPQRVKAQQFTVKSVERVTLAGYRWGRDPYTPIGTGPWPFIVLHTIDGIGKSDLIAFEPDSAVLPTVGSDVYVGTIDRSPFSYNPFFYVPDGVILRYSVADDERYSRLQHPESEQKVRLYKRNQWFQIGSDEAWRGHIDAALSAFRGVVANDDDPVMRASDRATLQRCESLDGLVHAGKMSVREARDEWYNGCQTKKQMLGGFGSHR